MEAETLLAPMHAQPSPWFSSRCQQFLAALCSYQDLRIAV
jgi:hypothetical protein